MAILEVWPFIYEWLVSQKVQLLERADGTRGMILRVDEARWLF